VLYSTFVILPLINTVYYSFFDWHGFGPMEFIGFDNYRRILFDERMSSIVTNALFNNIKFVLAVLLINMPIQIFVAYMIYVRVPGHAIFQTLIFLPFVLSKAIIGFFATMVFDPNIGIVNTTLERLGFGQHAPGWFGDPNLAFPLFLTVALWQGLGVGMLIFLSNLKGLSHEILEQSVIDGASGGQRFFRIVLPMIVPAVTTVTVLSTIFALVAFELPLILGGQNGGVSNTLDFVNLVFYRYTFSGTQGGETQLSFGASIVSILFVFVFFVAFLQLAVFNKINLEE
jgi:ABC-type sugar transport system permease subunit